MFFTPSGDRIVFASWSEQTGDDIGMVGTGGGGLTWLLDSSYNEFNAELSPDGRWMAASCSISKANCRSRSSA